MFTFINQGHLQLFKSESNDDHNAQKYNECFKLLIKIVIIYTFNLLLKKVFNARITKSTLHQD